MNVHSHPHARLRRRRPAVLASLTVLLAALGSTSLAPAQPAPANRAQPPAQLAPAPLEQQIQPSGAGRTYQVSLRQLGAEIRREKL